MEDRLAKVLALLGDQATLDDARQVLDVIDSTGSSIDDVSSSTWAWLRTGNARPRSSESAFSTTLTLVEIFAGLDDDQKAELIANARRIAETH